MNLSILTKLLVAGKLQLPGEDPKSEFRGTAKTFSDNMVLQKDKSVTVWQKKNYEVV